MQKQVAVNVQRRRRGKRGEGVLKNVEKLEQIGKWANGLALSLSSPLFGSYLRLWPRALENTREKCRNKINRKGE